MDNEPVLPESAEVQLPFDTRKQLAILGHLLADEKFFEICRSKVKPDWFNDVRAQKIYATQLKYRSQNTKPPTPAEVSAHSDIVSLERKEVVSIQGVVQKALDEAQNFRLDALRKEMTSWYHARVFREGVERSVRLFNQGQFAQASELAYRHIEEIKSTKFDEEEEIRFTDPHIYLSEEEKISDQACTTGIKLLDDALVPSGDAGVIPEGRLHEGKSKGGLYPGDTTIFLAPSNVGKTLTLITVLAHNVLRGKHVLYMTHEGNVHDLRRKVLCSILGVNSADIFNLYKTPEGIEEVSKAVKHCELFLTYIAYNKAGMTVEDILPIVRRQQELRKARRNGKGYDLFINDYPAKLSTVMAAKGLYSRRHVDEQVYGDLVQLGIEMNWHNVFAIQTNRQGSKENKAAGRLLTMEDVLESWGPMTSATNVISINRDEEAAKHKRLTFYVCKTRSSRANRAVVCRTNFAACRTHSDEMGGTAYWGTDTMSDRVDKFLEDHNGKVVPDYLTH